MFKDVEIVCDYTFFPGFRLLLIIGDKIYFIINVNICLFMVNIKLLSTIVCDYF